MSIDRHIYVGPYLRCAEQTMPVEVPIWGCQKCRNEKNRSQPYCSTCGSPLSEIAVQRYEPTVDALALSEQIGEALYEHKHKGGDSEQVCWMPNRSALSYARHITPRPGNSIVPGAVEIAPDDIVQALLSFATDFTDAIAAVTLAYGEQNSSLAYGIVIYYD